MSDSGTQITLAIISAVASALGGGIAWLQANRATRAATNAQLELQRMQASEARWQHALGALQSESREVGAAMSEAWQAVQDVRDEVLRLLDIAHHDLDVGLRLVASRAQRLTEDYGRWGARLPANARGVWHRSKNVVSSLEQRLGELTHLRTNRDLDDATRQLFDHARRELRDCQDVLANEQRRLLASMVADLVDGGTHRNG